MNILHLFYVVLVAVGALALIIAVQTPDMPAEIASPDTTTMPREESTPVATTTATTTPEDAEMNTGQMASGQMAQSDTSSQETTGESGRTPSESAETTPASPPADSTPGASQEESDTTPEESPQTTPPPQEPEPDTSEPAETQPEEDPAPEPERLTVAADDFTADPSTLQVASGTPVMLTFNVSADRVYYGGLDFRSPVVNSGTILPGESGTVSFTATESFSFKPYWPASNVAKSYSVDIVVE